MKLIITGATGYVASEIIRQSLSIPEITSVVALARTPVTPPPNILAKADISKLKSVIIKDYEVYPEDVRKEFAGAQACIWQVSRAGQQFLYEQSPTVLTYSHRTVAITPSRSNFVNFDEVKRVCQSSPLAGLKAMHEAGPEKPFRFIFMSAQFAPGSDKGIMAQYIQMRSETEDKLFATANEHPGEIQACMAKPGFISPATVWSPTNMVRWATSGILNMAGMPVVTQQEIAAALLHHAVHGFDVKGRLLNDDLVRIGRQALSASL
ncbi:hypothetical protein HDV00_010593 [Rhizophlyctis rosea]|nr:hypothetical protein HDV00_010593 [Rhizophlyctis rosea]